MNGIAIDQSSLSTKRQGVNQYDNGYNVGRAKLIQAEFFGIAEVWAGTIWP